MTVPLMLDPPPVVTQTEQTCWAASFESWARACEARDGVASTITAERLIELFEGSRGLTSASGRATTDGIMLMAGMGLMHLVPFNARRVSIEVLGRALERGYIYLVYFRVGHPAHAVVLYGVDAQWIHVMDPWPGRGLIQLPANHFLTLRHGRVLLGFPLLGDLTRGLSTSLAPLLSDGH